MPLDQDFAKKLAWCLVKFKQNSHFYILVQIGILHYNPPFYSIKNFTKIWRCQKMYMIHLYAIKQPCVL